MAIDIAGLITTAQRLINENGRSITLVEFNRTPANVAEPWKGAADPRAVPDSTLVIDGLFVEPSSAVKLGLAVVDSDLVKRSDQIIIVSPGAAADLTVFHEVIDGSVRWKVTTIEILKPGASVALAYIGVKR